VAELKRESKIRGLSPRGHKATLIQKIQEHDRSNANDLSIPVAARDLSTSSTFPAQGVAPGIPSVTQSMPDSRQNFMVNIPEVPHADPEFSVQIPYVPDFWDSSVSVDSPQMEEPLPKLLVVAGADTHPGGGPSHNLLDANLHHETSDVKNNSTTQSSSEGKIWDDVTEDLGLLSLREMKAGFWKTFS